MVFWYGKIRVEKPITWVISTVSSGRLDAAAMPPASGVITAGTPGTVVTIHSSIEISAMTAKLRPGSPGTKPATSTSAPAR